MKTAKIILLIVWSLITIMLVAFLIFALSTGFFGNSTNWFGISIENFTGEMVERQTWEVDASRIERIKIDWVAGNIDIEPYDGDKILITESSRRELAEDESAFISDNGTSLDIIFKKNTKFFFFLSTPEKALTVKIPKNLYAEFNVESVSSGVYMRDIISSDITVEVVSGSVKILDCQSDKADISTVSGGVTVSGSYPDFRAGTVSGSVNADFESCPDEIRIETVSGGVTISLPSDSVFSLKYDKISGKLTNDFPTQNKSSSGKKITVETVSGSLKIKAKTAGNDSVVDESE